MDRIAVDHRVMGGMPCIQGTRIPVSMIVGRIAEGASESEVLEDYPQLTPDDIHAALRYAAAVLDQRELPLQSAA
ncbi:DUF433 domain-containing protein [Nesterenkonia alkaliphila]|uniref:DUF433 domain-containing protein n=1 Tax=Nesterenkonia alkaliphila TaxID=1463631 RepID=A0A7K1UFK8_9MICC|nr:DUF433 domain-containing protein [Nesterenkonia alkaliphila]MVT25212.1 DUF433 domain-containing protein [Nesterenkonia alkaliphila]GFZ97557.1 hypothetical protein GCM10011359_28590 [Nesterenkonia alkaliphila]